MIEDKLKTVESESTHGEIPPPKAGRKEWLGLAVIALPCVLYSMDLTVLNLAVPHLTADLKPSSSQLLWIVDIYGFFVAGLLITMGTLGDRIGRRKLLLIGASAFGVASIVAAFSTSAEMLIGARALLGIAGATLAPSTLSLIRNMFLDPKERTLAIGVWVTSYSAGGAIGPLIGGILLEYFWWGSVFLVGVPVMVLLLILGPILLPEFRDPKAGKLDLVSAALSLTAVLSIIYGLKKGAESGIGYESVLSFVAGIIIGALFLRRQKKLADPMIDLKLFGSLAFSTSLGVYTFVTFIAFGAFIFIFQYLQLVLGLSPLEAGVWSLPSFVGFIVGSMVAPVLVRHVHPSKVIEGGLVLAAIGFALLAQVDVNSGLPFVVSGMLIYSLGIGPVITLATDMIVGAAPPERAGAAAALSETSSEFGGALGIAILGSIGTAIYRSKITAGMPEKISHKMVQEATDTLGGAIDVASQLPSEVGRSLIQTANVSFVAGMQLNAWIAATIAGVLAILSVIVLRKK